ncbi:MAG: hypothetical protein AAB590_01485 [Patescibacteria group bacterium]
MKKGSGNKNSKKIGLDEFKMHTGVLIEHMDERFNAVNETLDHHTKILNSHSKTLDSHTQTLDSHTKTLDSHTQMIGQIMLDVEQIKFDLKQKVSYDDFAKLEKRVARMEIRLQSA